MVVHQLQANYKTSDDPHGIIYHGIILFELVLTIKLNTNAEYNYGTHVNCSVKQVPTK